jgi:hypothetical protein
VFRSHDWEIYQIRKVHRERSGQTIIIILVSERQVNHGAIGCGEVFVVAVIIELMASWFIEDICFRQDPIVVWFSVLISGRAICRILCLPVTCSDRVPASRSRTFVCSDRSSQKKNKPRVWLA